MPSALQPTAHIPFLPGIREDVDPTAAPPGMLVDAENVRFGRNGGIYPRRGTQAIPRNSICYATDVPAGVGTYVRNNTGYLLAGGVAFAMDDATDRLHTLGAYSAVVPWREFSAATGVGFGLSKYGCAINSDGYVCTAVNADGNLEITIYTPDGLALEQLRGFTSGSGACVVAVADLFVVVYASTSTALVATTFQNISSASASISAGTVTAVGTLSGASAGWDVCPASDGVHYYLAYQSTATNLRINRNTTAHVNNALLNQTVTSADTPCSLYADADRVWLGWYEAPATVGNVRHRTAFTTLSTFIDATQTLETVVNTAGPPLIGPAVPGNSDSGTAFAVWRCSLGSASNYLVGTRYRHLLGGALAATATKTLWHHHPISKPGSGSLVWCMTGNQAPNCAFQRAVLMTMQKEASSSHAYNEPVIACSRPTTEVASGTGTTSALASSAGLINVFGALAERNGRVLFGVPEVAQKGVFEFAPTATADRIKIVTVEVRTEAAEPSRHSSGRGETLTVDGQLHEFPGRLAPWLGFTRVKGGYETGFAYAPIVLSHATTSVSGSLTTLGVYSWVFVFEWIDQFGRLHQSAPSVPYNITLTGAEIGVAFEVTSLAGSTRSTSAGGYPAATLVTYRTLNGVPGIYYRAVAPSDEAFAGSSNGVALDVFAGSSDAIIGAKQVIYTSAGVKDNVLAPACRFSCDTEDRLILGGGFNRYILHASKQIFPGYPIAFSDSEAFQIALPEPCTGLAYQDGTIVAFAERAIYVVTGDGPDDQGIGQFSPPRAISRDIGCPDWRSIVETSRGIMFRSQRGFYLLPRGNGAPVFIGAAVQARFSPTAYPLCLGAAAYACSEHRTVRWLLSDGGTDTPVVIYDLDASESDANQGWSYDTHTDQLAAIGVWPQGLALFDSSFASSTRIGYLEQMTPLYTGDGSNAQAITSAIETADIRSAGPAGYFKLMSATALLSEPDGGTLTITITTDGSSLVTPFAMSSASGSVYRHVAPANVACSAAQVRLSCARTTVTRGPTFHALTLEQIPIAGGRRTTTAERT